MPDKKLPECPEEGRLPVDLYETDEEIVLRTVIAGVDQSEIDISINNDMVTIRGEQKNQKLLVVMTILNTNVIEVIFLKLVCYHQILIPIMLLPILMTKAF